MGRRSRNVELLETLIDWAGGQPEFERLTKIRIGDQKHFLVANKTVAMKRLKRAASEVFKPPPPPSFKALVERAAVPSSLPKYLSGTAGVYGLFASDGRLIYFGKATNLRAEIAQTLSRWTPKVLVQGTSKRQYKFSELAEYYSAYEVVGGDPKFRHDLESLVIRCIRSGSLNGVGGHFQR
jgi:hypothetical protein